MGGYTISISDVPWTVLIIYNGYPLCGGSIISTSKIVSAAHCTIGRNKKNFLIRAGTSKSSGRGGQKRKISRKIEHPHYSYATNENDIAILSLRRNLRLTSHVSVISIDRSASGLLDGNEVLATGWGRICESCDASHTLLAVRLPVIDNDRCRRMYGKYSGEFKILPSMLCCGSESGGIDTCQGDSGGPIVFNNKLVGIVSFGIGCARPNFPGVYTRVSYFATWIKSHL